MNKAIDETVKPDESSSSKGRSYSGLSQAERKAIRQQQFLEAGIKLFGTVGFRAVTVRALCKEAKLTDRYFYEAYGSLEKCVMAAYEHCMTSVIKQALDAMKSGYCRAGVRCAVEESLDTFFAALEDSHCARICMIELEGISPEVDALYNNYIQNIAKVFVEMAEKAKPDLELSEQEKHVLAISIIGVLRQTATSWLLDDYNIPRSVVVSGVTKVFLGTLAIIGIEA